MAEHQKRQCRLCIWWDYQHERVRKLPDLRAFGVVNPGLCRKHKPGAERVAKGIFLGVQPVMDADDECGEFRLPKGEQ